MTWLEEERVERTALRAAFDALRAEFASLRHTVETAIERQNTAIERQTAALERGLKEQMRFLYLAWAVILAAVVGIYTRVG